MTLDYNPVLLALGVSTGLDPTVAEKCKVVYNKIVVIDKETFTNQIIKIKFFN